MASYTAILFINPDGTHTARIPAISGCQADGRTRAEALENVAKAAGLVLAERGRAGQLAPREEWTPARTVRVHDPRRGDSLPYCAAVERTENGQFRTTLVLFPDLEETGTDIEEALGRLSARLYQRLEGLVVQGRRFPLQDDAHAYVINVAEPEG